MAWRYIAERLQGDGTGTVIDTNLPLQDVDITRVHSGPDRLTASVSPAIARLIGSDGRRLLEPWSTAIYAEVDGHIRAGGILASDPFDGPDLRLDCMGFTGYAEGMPWVGPAMPYAQGVEADPLDLFRVIWAHLQGHPGGNLGLVVDDTTSPVRIGYELEQVEFDTQAGPVAFEAGPYKLDEWTTDNLGSKLDALATDTPFDYDEEHSWNSDRTAIDHRLRLWYPARGSRRHDLRFVIGENIRVIPQVERDGEDYASEVLVLGAGEGRDMVRGLASVQTTRLRRATVVTDKSIRTATKASALAREEAAFRSGLDGEVTTVVVDDWFRTGADLGDEIRVQGRLDWGKVDLWGRVLDVSFTPASSDSATVTLQPSRVP